MNFALHCREHCVMQFCMVEIIPGIFVQLLYGIQFCIHIGRRKFLNKFVGQFRRICNTLIIQRDGKDSIFTGQFFCIFFRESNCNIKCFPNGMSDHLLFKSLNKHAGSDGQFISLCSTSFERFFFTFQNTGKIEINKISFFNRAFFNLFRCRSIIQDAADIAFNFIIFYLNLVGRNFDV